MADVGTGHGRLAIALWETGCASQVIATEPVPAPLREAERNVAAAGATGVSIRLGWGLDPLRPGEVTQVCVAGMGGDTICRILERGLETARWVSRLILQPQNHPDRVRKWLGEHGFGLVAEDLVEERGHFYPVMAAALGVGWFEAVGGPWPTELPEVWVLRLGPLLLAERHPVLLRQVERLLAERRALLARLEQMEGHRARSSRERLAGETSELELIRQWLRQSPRSSE